MASENETVADIIKEIRQVGPYTIYKKPIFADAAAVSEPYLKRFMYGHFVTDFGTIRLENPKVKEVSNYELADRIEAAHRRETAKLKNKLGCLQEEVEALDAEIARLRRPTAVDDDLLKMARDIDTYRATNAKLREALRQAIVEYCHDCAIFSDGKCGNKPGSCFVQEWRKVLEGASK